MDIKIFFSPLDESLREDITEGSTFYKNISANEESMPDYNGVDIAIIGLEENRGTIDNEGVNKGANEIRRKLYNLKKGSGTYNIIDLGNLRNGVDLEETILRLREVCEILICHDVLPIIIGGSHDLDIGQYKAYENMEKLVSVLNVDAEMDMNEASGQAPNRNHIHKLLLHEPNFLFNYCLMGYQTYLVEQEAINVLEKLYFDSYRLGQLRENIKEMEPVVREADMMTFDIGAINANDAPGNVNAQPFGLSAEQACQLCWYAGLSEKLSSVGFYEYNPDEDNTRMKTAQVIATMVWYFVEGFYHRKNEKDFKTNDYLKYVVSMPNEPATIVFYKSKLSEKWWLEVPFPEEKAKTGFMNSKKRPYTRNCIVPCSYSDYEKSTKGDVPERWISTYAKLI